MKYWILALCVAVMFASVADAGIRRKKRVRNAVHKIVHPFQCNGGVCHTN